MSPRLCDGQGRALSFTTKREVVLLTIPFDRDTLDMWELTERVWHKIHAENQQSRRARWAVVWNRLNGGRW